jgi:ParB family chromosome partitioning protein
MQFQQIKDREVNTRPLDPDHVIQLAESIAILGLIEPLVVDQYGTLLAGGHRKAAIQWIEDNDPTAYQSHFPKDRIPVRIMPFDAALEPELALQVEVSENEKRRDYTPAEIRDLATRLRQAGYTDTPGRPGKGEKRLRPALEVIVGKSLRQVRRILNEDEKTRTLDRVSKKQAILLQFEASIEKWMKLTEEEKQDEVSQSLSKQLPKFLKLVRSAIMEDITSR